MDLVQVESGGKHKGREGKEAIRSTKELTELMKLF